MKKPPMWFVVVVAIAIVWNVVGLFAVIADLRLSAADLAALPRAQQELYAARPLWSVLGSLVAVVCGTVGCIALLLRRKWSIFLLYASLLGVVVQDVGLFIVAGLAQSNNMVAFILQGLVLLIAVGLVLLARFAAKNSWLT